MPKKKTVTKKQVDALVHEDAKRKNIPTAEFESVMDKDAQSYFVHTHNAPGATLRQRHDRIATASPELLGVILKEGKSE